MHNLKYYPSKHITFLSLGAWSLVEETHNAWGGRGGKGLITYCSRQQLLFYNKGTISIQIFGQHAGKSLLIPFFSQASSCIKLMWAAKVANWKRNQQEKCWFNIKKQTRETRQTDMGLNIKSRGNGQDKMVHFKGGLNGKNSREAGRVLEGNPEVLVGWSKWESTGNDKCFGRQSWSKAELRQV